MLHKKGRSAETQSKGDEGKRNIDPTWFICQWMIESREEGSRDRVVVQHAQTMTRFKAFSNVVSFHVVSFLHRKFENDSEGGTSIKAMRSWPSRSSLQILHTPHHVLPPAIYFLVNIQASNLFTIPLILLFLLSLVLIVIVIFNYVLKLPSGLVDQARRPAVSNHVVPQLMSQQPGFALLQGELGTTILFMLELYGFLCNTKGKV